MALKRVVLIDDERFDQIAYRRTLEASGIVEEIITFRSAIDALEFFKADPPPVDLILLDVNMPRMNGFEFLEALDNRFDDIDVSAVVIMLTTSLDPRDRERALKFDVVRDFISKPLTVDQVAQIARTLGSTAAPHDAPAATGAAQDAPTGTWR